MGVHCHILIKKSKYGHVAGGAVEGVVRYALDTVKEFKHINLYFSGKAKCRWSEPRTKHGRERAGSGNVIYSNKKTYMDQQISVLSKGGMDVVTVNPGSYEFPFLFEIPADAPSTYRDSKCSITYKLKMKFVDNGVFSVNKNFEKEIYVQGFVCPCGFAGPQIFGITKTVLKLFSNKNNKIEVQGVISDSCVSMCEQFSLKLSVRNNSSVAVTSIKTELCSKRTLIADNGRKHTDSKTIYSSVVETPSVPANGSAELSCLVPTSGKVYSIQARDIIEKEFFVRVTLRLPIPYINASAEIPVVIGRKHSPICETQFVREELTDDPPSYWEVMAEGPDSKG